MLNKHNFHPASVCDVSFSLPFLLCNGFCIALAFAFALPFAFAIVLHFHCNLHCICMCIRIGFAFNCMCMRRGKAEIRVESICCESIRIERHVNKLLQKNPATKRFSEKTARNSKQMQFAWKGYARSC